MNRDYKNEALMVCHQSARDLFELGVIDDAEMREFDEGCLVRNPQAAKSRNVPACASSPKTAAAALAKRS